jgi:hypothetical protein
MALTANSVSLFLIAIACTSKPSKVKNDPSKGALLVFDSTSGKYVVSAADKKLI